MYPRIVDIPLPFHLGSLDSLTVYSYGLMVVVGVLAASWLAARELDRLFRAGRLPGVQVPVEEKGGGEKGGRERKRRRRKQQTRTASPSVLMGTIATLAIVGGIVGARLFFILENMDQLAADPLGTIFSSGGLTFYGGFLLAGALIIWFLHRHGLSVRAFADAIAPGLMLAYGIGRIGCYLAGDGDWGVCSDLADKPAFLPAWLWSEDFKHSILGAPAPVLQHCGPSANGVYPTMLYEFAAAALIAAALWALRKHPYESGWLFSCYLVFSGVERFLIELIRVNPSYAFLGTTVTQAEVIAPLLVLAGVIGLFFFWKKRDRTAEQAQAEKNRELLHRRQEAVTS